ncbi:unnamed protein product [Bemisia tabaci]|uniref:Programmed cell death protein 2 C-terminal domain-containing protein n=1 Tax=Bemisia tabaci TaxID=7038 RepID=A0A9P0AGA8_BEMTA|nr:PREDICTED: programmed cell death protein 2-like [Bemisia tabaci]CAH0390941.1 unnamed protein product [Bemisia tabaci]
MAKRWPLVYLGFEDEAISDKHRPFLSYTTNKIGGKPDWHVKGSEVPSCQLCSFPLLLVVQIYAPLPKSPNHRTLYLFACINPNCWNQNGSWVCVRSESTDSTSETKTNTTVISTDDWCGGADNWGEDEQNGNLTYNSSPDEDSITNDFTDLSLQGRNSTGGELSEAMGGGAAGAEAEGRLMSPIASAEIEVEGEEREMVTIDTPTAPEVNIVALLEQAPAVPEVKAELLQFVPIFISVMEEETTYSGLEHVNDLLQVYQQNNPGELDNFNTNQNPFQKKDRSTNPTNVEKYEPSTPSHGDKMFHQFVTKIQQNPGQILRYCREGGSPLFLYPVQDTPRQCQHCKGELLFELQVLPSLIPKLNLQTPSGTESGHLEFGSVYIFSCKKSCWSSTDKWRKEIVIVQAERI